jgi:FkbM family methyltransferase
LSHADSVSPGPAWTPSAVRLAMERATRALTFRRRLPAAFGRVPIVVSPAAGLRFLFRRMADVDPILLSQVREFIRQGQVVWDVGANVGLFSVAAAALAGPRGAVIAIEPDAWLVPLLRRSARLQADTSAPITVVPCGVAGATGLRTFCISRRSRSSNYLAEYGHSQTGGEAERQTIVTLTLDDLLRWLPPPKIVKVDVEGAEMEVLSGAARLLEVHRPILLLEVGEQASEEVTAFLKTRAYRLRNGEDAGPNRKPIDRAAWSTIATPD